MFCISPQCLPCSHFFLQCEILLYVFYIDLIYWIQFLRLFILSDVFSSPILEGNFAWYISVDYIWWYFRVWNSLFWLWRLSMFWMRISRFFGGFNFLCDLCFLSFPIQYNFIVKQSQCFNSGVLLLYSLLASYIWGSPCFFYLYRCVFP